jgi:hypothetical protein
LKYLSFEYRAETPPNTPQRARAAARQNERENRTLDSPQRHRTPHQPLHPQIEPLQFHNAPIPQIPPLPQNPIPLDDPFAQPAPVHFNGQQYHHLPPELAQRLQNLNALPATTGRGRGHGRGHGNAPPVSVNLFFLFFFMLNDDYPPQYNHLPPNLAQQYAALLPLQPVRGRGRGRGYVPPLPPVCFFYFY